MKKVFRYRIITNFHCNQNCSFCFQPLKDKIILDLNILKETLKKTPHLERATIMGGESMLLDNLPEYISIMNEKVDTVCLVTNGSLITEDNLFEYRKAGLEEIAISISSIEQYFQRRDQILLANEIFGVDKCRVNIPKCEESVGHKLYNMLDNILIKDNIGVVVCEDLLGRYVKYDFDTNKDCTLIHTDGCNFLTYQYKEDTQFGIYKYSRRFGLFAHYSGYDKTDIIITPIGNFASWKKYCKAIGQYDLH